MAKTGLGCKAGGLARTTSHDVFGWLGGDFEQNREMHDTHVDANSANVNDISEIGREINVNLAIPSRFDTSPPGRADVNHSLPSSKTAHAGHADAKKAASVPEKIGKERRAMLCCLLAVIALALILLLSKHLSAKRSNGGKTIMVAEERQMVLKQMRSSTDLLNYLELLRDIEEVRDMAKAAEKKAEQALEREEELEKELETVKEMVAEAEPELAKAKAKEREKKKIVNKRPLLRKKKRKRARSIAPEVLLQHGAKEAVPEISGEAVHRNVYDRLNELEAECKALKRHAVAVEKVLRSLDKELSTVSDEQRSLEKTLQRDFATTDADLKAVEQAIRNLLCRHNEERRKINELVDRIVEIGQNERAEEAIERIGDLQTQLDTVHHTTEQHSETMAEHQQAIDEHSVQLYALQNALLQHSDTLREETGRLGGRADEVEKMCQRNSLKSGEIEKATARVRTDLERLHANISKDLVTLEKKCAAAMRIASKAQTHSPAATATTTHERVTTIVGEYTADLSAIERELQAVRSQMQQISKSRGRTGEHSEPHASKAELRQLSTLLRHLEGRVSHLEDHRERAVSSMQRDLAYRHATKDIFKATPASQYNVDRAYEESRRMAEEAERDHEEMYREMRESLLTGILAPVRQIEEDMATKYGNAEVVDVFLERERNWQS